MRVRHPLDPLTKDELQSACDLLKAQKELTSFHRFAYVRLHEPHQNDVLKWREGDPISRQVFFCVFDARTNVTHEAIVDLNTQAVIDWKLIPPSQGQAPILLSEYPICERIVKSDPAWRQAMHDRGLTDAEIDRIQIDPFSAGYSGRPDEEGKRIVRAVSFYRDRLTDNAYARPIDGIIAVVDFTAERVLRLDDFEKIPIPSRTINYRLDAYPDLGYELGEYNFTQPGGPSFSVNNWQTKWGPWKFRFKFDQRTGVELDDVQVLEDGEYQTVIHNASLTEMIVPYADPSDSHKWKCAFDGGESRFGTNMEYPLDTGVDCVGNVRHFSPTTVDDFGNTYVMRNAICMHEIDKPIIWAASDARSGVKESRRDRCLEISWKSRIDNYLYRFAWKLKLNKTFDFSATLTGVMQTAALRPGESYPHGTLLTPDLVAITHQHFISVRFHMAVKGPRNCVSEHSVGSVPVGPDNPDGVCIDIRKRNINCESEGICYVGESDDERSWQVYNPNITDDVGYHPAYELTLRHTAKLRADKTSSVYKRAGFARAHVFFTQYHPDEKYASGSYPNLRSGDDGVWEYAKKNRNLNNESIVAWVTLGKTHKPRREEFPAMPKAKMSLRWSPFNFSKSNPLIGLKPQFNSASVSHSSCCDDEAAAAPSSPGRRSTS